MGDVCERFDMILDFEIGRECLDGISVLILGGEQGEWNGDVGCVVGINHCRVGGHSSGERCA